jgi:hypothetical protein
MHQLPGMWSRLVMPGLRTESFDEHHRGALPL